MRAPLTSVAFALLTSAGACAQSETMMAHVGSLKEQAHNNGFTEVNEGWAMTWGDDATLQGQTYVFGERTFYAGHTYIVAVVVEDCVGCEVRIEWHRDDGSFYQMPTEVQQDGQFTMARVQNHQDYDANGRIRTYVLSPELRSTYALIFESGN